MKIFKTFVTLLCSSVAIPAIAQGNGDASVDGNVIVVTALKGNTTAQDAPTTVVIVSGDALIKQSVVAVEDLQKVVPGIRIQQSPGGVINPIVRGLGTSSTVPSFEQSIGLFVDGVFAGHSREYSSALFDIERIELLKGTQASVVGKSTSLGALSVVTRKPIVGEFGYNLSASHEFELGGDTVTGAVNVPMGDDGAFRVAGLYATQGGWIENAFGLSDAPDSRRIGVRFSMRMQPTDALDWTVSGQYSKLDVTGQYFHLGIDGSGGTYGAIAGAFGDTDFNVAPFENRYTKRPGFSMYGFDEPGSETSGTKFTSSLEYDLGSATLTSTTGYGQYKDAYIFDGYGIAQLPFLSAGREEDETFSQELRIGSNGDGALSYLVGAYYYYDKWMSINAANYSPAVGGGVFESSYIQKVDTLSAFGQLGYDITEAFKVSGSIRYENMKKTGDFTREITTPGVIAGPAGVYQPFAPTTMKGEDDYVTWSAQAQYFVNDDAMVYASYATGVKGFGFMNLPPTIADAPYKAERSKSAEVGAKVSLGGGSHINVAGFYTWVNDYQIGVNVGGGQFNVFNDDVRIKGVEGDILLKVVPGLTLNAALTYADVKKRGTIRADSIQGQAFSAKFSGLVSVDYTMPIDDRFDLNLGSNMEFRTSQFLHDTVAFNNLIGKQPGYAKFGASIGVEDNDTGLSVAVIGNNLFNKYNLTSAFPAPFNSAAVSEDRPRTVMLQMTIKR